MIKREILRWRSTDVPLAQNDNGWWLVKSFVFDLLLIYQFCMIVILSRRAGRVPAVAKNLFL